MKVFVGEEKRKFVLHEELLCKHSLFFAAAAKKEWNEGQDRTVALADDNSEIFDLYVQWLYLSKILSRKPTTNEDTKKGDRELEILVDAFIFGEKIQDGPFKDAIIDSMIMYTATPDRSGARWFPTKSTVDRAYEETPVGSPLRRLLVDFHVWHGSGRWVEGTKSVEFLNDLAKDLLDIQTMPSKPDPTGANINSCSYHHHSDDQSCYSKTDSKSDDVPK